MRRLRRVLITAEMLVEVMKHGFDQVVVVKNALPEDATYQHATVDPFSGDVYLIIQSAAFAEVPEGAVIPEHPRVTFTAAQRCQFDGNVRPCPHHDLPPVSG